MLASILVATPHAAFGELLRISLQDSGQYQVRLVMSAGEVRTSASRGEFQLAILDAALSNETFVPLCLDLLEKQKGIRLIVIPPENDPNHPALGGLLPHGYLIRPFYLPDLIHTVTLLLNQRNAEFREDSQIAATLPPWLAEPLTLQSYLERELPTTQALAGIIGHHGPTPGSGNLRACAGQLPGSAVQEVTNIVFRYWNHNEKTDLMRFVRLGMDKRDYLIYTTSLSGELVLILVYDTAAPLSQIRPQTKMFAQKLASHPPEDLPPASGQTPADTSSAKPDMPDSDGPTAVRRRPNRPVFSSPGRLPADEPTQPDVREEPFTANQPHPDQQQAEGNRPSTEGTPDADIYQSLRMVEPVDENSEPPYLSTFTEEDHQLIDDFNFSSRIYNKASPPDAQDEIETEDDGLPVDTISLSALLGSIPSPDPGKEPIDSGWVPETPVFSPSQAQPEAQKSWERVELPEREQEHNQSSIPSISSGQAVIAQADTFFSPDQHPASQMSTLGLSPGVTNEIDSLEDTRPHIIAALTSLNQLEPSSPALSQINYTCVLIPRLPQHYLTGELADRLAFWVHQLCLAFGWRLEGIAIRPEYLQWTVQVSPSISPGNLVRIVRQRTSLNIFNQFTHLGDQNPSGDFWATGYLIVSGAQPPSAQLLRDYINQTRKRQGILK